MVGLLTIITAGSGRPESDTVTVAFLQDRSVRQDAKAPNGPRPTPVPSGFGH